MTNGKLLAAAEAAAFDVLITVDQNLPRLNPITRRSIAVIVLSAPTTNYEDLAVLIPDVLETLASILPGQSIRIPG